MWTVQLQRALSQPDDFFDRYRPALTTRRDGSSWARREDTFRAGNAYFRGLLLPGERKSMQPLARAADTDYESLQQFVTDSTWDPFAVMERGVEIFLEDSMVSADALLVLDDVSWVKQGKNSVGVGYQWCGAVGKAANCQDAVDLVYSIPGKTRNADALHYAVAMELFLPRAWIADRSRRKRARVPPRLQFRTKTMIGIELVDLAARKGLPFRAVVGDAGYGRDGEFRAALRARGTPFALGVPPTSGTSFVPEDTPLELPGLVVNGGVRKFARYRAGVEPVTPERWAARLGRSTWKTVRWSEGTKGGNLSRRFARVRARVVTHGRERRATDETGWLLLEQRENDLKSYFCWGLDGSSLKELVEIAHGRWVVEQYHQQLKGEVGFDHFEGRTWAGWHHHAAMVMMAYNYLQWARAKAPAGQALPTLPEIHRQYMFNTAVLHLEERDHLTRAAARKKAEELWPWFKPG